VARRATPPPEKFRQKPLRIRLNPEERRLVDEAAEPEGDRSTSAWARDGLLRLAKEVHSMKRKIPAQEPILDEAPDVDLTGLKVVSADSQPKIGTLSFPVRGDPVYAPISDNTALIVEVIERRHPAFLLCAGWTVPTEPSLAPIIAVTRQFKTVVMVETALPNAAYFRIADGRAIRMGEQFFSTREESDDESLPRGLADAMPDRSFTFRQRDALLLNCGEVMVVHGRDYVDFYWSVPQVLRDAVRAPAAMILNPTHTRMGNCGSVKAWREFLSGGGRIYISASNWDVLNGQRQSDTLHSLWHDGVAATPTYTFENERLCYREWDMPVSAGEVGVGPRENLAYAD
jgi:hypothetical protein